LSESLLFADAVEEKLPEAALPETALPETIGAR
jgi:hypothetical protein